MAGPSPAIHVLKTRKKDVDARHYAGHDENYDLSITKSTLLL